MVLDAEDKYSFNEDGSEMTIMEVAKLDEGEYTCIARNKAGESDQELSLRVFGEQHTRHGAETLMQAQWSAFQRAQYSCTVVCVNVLLSRTQCALVLICLLCNRLVSSSPHTLCISHEFSSVAVKEKC